jgi:hypothetical protein
MPKKKESKLTSQEQQVLEQARDILEIIKSPGWLAIATYIQNNIVFPNPKDFATLDDLLLPYAQAYGGAELAKKIGQFVGSQEDIVKSLTKKIDSENALPNYDITG